MSIGKIDSKLAYEILRSMSHSTFASDLNEHMCSNKNDFWIDEKSEYLLDYGTLIAKLNPNQPKKFEAELAYSILENVINSSFETEFQNFDKMIQQDFKLSDEAMSDMEFGKLLRLLKPKEA